ncbi:DUF159 domain-containing protein [Dentipellis sp. KUC8613]|nr:DUF159 domain-containing protein [Dentipellis sp. KUC8613]
MCGRFALALPSNQVEQVPGYPVIQHRIRDWVGRGRFVPRYNIAPRSQAPVVRRQNAGPPPEQAESSSSESSSKDLVLQTMKWGLVPHWSKSEPSHLNTINARSESLEEGGGSIKGKRRCVVPVQGYYEWAKKGKERLPHFIRHKDGKIMLLAGLYDVAHLEGQSEPLWTFTIVTTAANKELEWLHDRQPVILVDQDAIDAWLNTESQTWTKELGHLLDPYNESSSPLECYPVPKEVGKVGTESPTFIEPISKRKDGIEAMFTKQKTKASSASGKSLEQPSQASGTKRKRSLSDPPTSPKTDPADVSSDRDTHQAGKDSSKRPTKGEASGESDIEILPGPSQESKTRSKHAKADEDSSPPSSQRSTKKKRLTKSGSPKKADKVESESSHEITSFFSKA